MGVTRGQLPQRAGLLGLNGGGAAAAVPPKLVVLWLVSHTSLRFRSIGPSTENARRPREFRRYDGTTSWWPAAERRWRLCAMSETGTQSAARYRGAAPKRKWWVKIQLRSGRERDSEITWIRQSPMYVACSPRCVPRKEGGKVQHTT